MCTIKWLSIHILCHQKFKLILIWPFISCQRLMGAFPEACPEMWDTFFRRCYQGNCEKRGETGRTGGRHSAVEGGFDSVVQGTVKEWRVSSELSQSEVRVLEDLLPCTSCYHCQQTKWVLASSLRTVPQTCRLSGEKVHQEATHMEIVRGPWVCGAWVESGWYCTEWLTPIVVLSSCI